MTEKLSADIGGKAGEKIWKLAGQSFKCTSCENRFRLSNFEGNPHRSGVEDAQGRKWWLFWTCPKCKSQFTLSQIENLIKARDITAQEV